MRQLRDYDLGTYEHCLRTEQVANKVSSALGLTEYEKCTAGIAARFHDVGKLRIPVELINKPGPLTEPEEQIVMTHQQEGFNLLWEAGMDSDVCYLVKYHHVDWKVFKKSLPVQMQTMLSVLMIADSIDAMLSDRPYREHLKESTAKVELLKYSGVRYNPKYVEEVIKCHLLQQG